LRWKQPGTQRWREKSARTTNFKEATRQAGVLEAKLNTTGYVDGERITWDEFVKRYEREHLAGKAKRTAEPFAAVKNHVERVIKPRRPGDMTTAAIAVLVEELRDVSKIRPTTIAGHLSHLRAALRWGHQRGLLSLLPQFSMPRTPKGTSRMRGRPITEEEFERLLAAAEKYRAKDADVWQFFLRGLWCSGLRLGEALELSWEREAGLSIELRDGRPFLRIKAEAEKGFKDRLIPTTPDFGQLLLGVPGADRMGRVFKLNGLRTHEPITPKRVSRIISAVGKKAGVVVNKEQGKFGSAHDLRRAYGTRWAKRLKPFELKTLMRHESIETTERYYVELDAEELGNELWKGVEACGNVCGDVASGDEKHGCDETDAAEKILASQRLRSAEGTGFEPATGFPAPHFQCGR
jgi:integrase